MRQERAERSEWLEAAHRGSVDELQRLSANKAASDLAIDRSDPEMLKVLQLDSDCDRP
jgi:hypothetical protein